MASDRRARIFELVTSLFLILYSYPYYTFRIIKKSSSWRQIVAPLSDTWLLFNNTVELIKDDYLKDRSRRKWPL